MCRRSNVSRGGRDRIRQSGRSQERKRQLLLLNTADGEISGDLIQFGKIPGGIFISFALIVSQQPAVADHRQFGFGAGHIESDLVTGFELSAGSQCQFVWRRTAPFA